jgi:hypothetical protein
VQAHQEESFKIMAKASGVTVPEFAEMWQGVRIFTLEENKAALKPGTTPANFRATVKDMSKFMVEKKLLEKPVLAESMVTADFLPSSK